MSFDQTKINVPVDHLKAYVDHICRPRLSRFWRMAGPLVVAQILAIGLFMSFFLLSCIKDGDWPIALGVLTAPAGAAYFARPFLLWRPNTTARIMNVAAAGCIFYGLFVHSRVSASIPYIEFIVAGYVSFHIGAMFWMLSDIALYPTRKRWWHW